MEEEFIYSKHIRSETKDNEYRKFDCLKTDMDHNNLLCNIDL